MNLAILHAYTVLISQRNAHQLLLREDPSRFVSGRRPVRHLGMELRESLQALRMPVYRTGIESKEVNAYGVEQKLATH